MEWSSIFNNSFNQQDMSKPKYEKGDWVVIKPNVDLYGGKMGRIIRTIAPGIRSNTVTLYTVKFDDGCADDFTGRDLKTPTAEQSRKYSRGRLEEGFAIADQLFLKGAKEAPKNQNSPVAKNIDWSDFKSEADKEWESFVK